MCNLATHWAKVWSRQLPSLKHAAVAQPSLQQPFASICQGAVGRLLFISLAPCCKSALCLNSYVLLSVPQLLHAHFFLPNLHVAQQSQLHELAFCARPPVFLLPGHALSALFDSTLRLLLALLSQRTHTNLYCSFPRPYVLLMTSF